MILLCKTTVILIFVSQISCSGSKKPETSGDLSDKVLVNGLSYPWELVWGPDNFIWMTERGGRVSRVNPATGQVIRIATIDEVIAQGEGGMLGMALHPEFNRHPYVYIAYNSLKNGEYSEKVMRYTYRAGALIEPRVIIDNIKAYVIHDGCRLLITPDLKLFITTGDASYQNLPQNKSSLNGKVLRLNLDGSIPADNPIAGNPYWSFGHRNAQGLVYANKIMYVSEHGPNSDDEINIIEKGRNYGWPEVMGYCNSNSERKFCAANNVMEPIKVWTPTAAVCGMDYYISDRIPGWKNSLLMVALKNARLYQMKLNETHTKIIETNEYLRDKYGRLRDVCVAPDGRVFVCTSNGNKKDVIVVIN